MAVLRAEMNSDEALEGDELLAQELAEEVVEREVRAAEAELGMLRRPARVQLKTEWTVEELYDTDLPVARWVVPEVLPVGLATLAGRPKVGKSWLALQLAAAVATGEPFLDWPVEQGLVFFITLEDPPRRLKERLLHLRVPRGAELQLSTDWPPLNSPEGWYDLQQSVAESRPRLVVIDTLARALQGGAAWQPPGGAHTVLQSLLQLAHEHGCCVLTVDHHRKGGGRGDVIDDLYGSTGKAAVIDTAWGLYREHGGSGATLQVTGREVEPRQLALAFDGRSQGWRRQEGEWLEVRTVVEIEIYELLLQLGEADAGTLARELCKDRTSVGKTLRRLRAKGQVTSKDIPASQGVGKRVLFRIAGGSQGPGPGLRPAERSELPE